MRICLITEYFHPENSGGSPTMLSELMRYLHDHYADIDIDVITSANLYRTPGGKLSPFEDWDGIRIHRVGAPKSNRDSTALRLLYGFLFSGRALFTAERIARNCDLVLVGTNPPSAPLIARLLSKGRDVPYCYLVHDLYPDIAVGLEALKAGNPVVSYTRSFQKKWLLGAQSVVVLGRCMRRHLVNAYGIPPEKVSVIPSWGDADGVKPLNRGTAFRREHGLHGFLVVYAGNLGYAQGLDMVLDAAKNMQGDDRDISFLLVGSGNARNHLESRVREEHLGNVRVLPSVSPERYPEVLGSSDVALVTLDPRIEKLAVPSKTYSILAAGKPLIAVMGANSEVGGMVVEHRCGERVDPGDVRGLVETVRRLHDNRTEREQMGLNARRTLVENYTLQKAAERFHTLFRSHISGEKETERKGPTLDPRDYGAAENQRDG